MAHVVFEDKDSLALHLARQSTKGRNEAVGVRVTQSSESRRRLKHKHHKTQEVLVNNPDDDDSYATLTASEEALLHEAEKELRHAEEKKRSKALKKRKKHVLDVLSDPGIRTDTHHGMIIDAGSTGSRMHVFEFEPRLLRTSKDVELAVSGKKLSFPGTESRWTQRLSPGLSDYSSIIEDAERQGVPVDEDHLTQAVGEYLSPLIEFAKNVLLSKNESWSTFPIYLKATAGMRMLPSDHRHQLMNAVHRLLHNQTYNPFWFETERARVISGEEEAIYGWAGVNFLLGTLLEDSAGSGTVVNPKKTYGALDLGGMSTQISFFESNGDIMGNLFKLQIGPGKHWNVYAHSFLLFGVNGAYERFGARLLSGLIPLPSGDGGEEDDGGGGGVASGEEVATSADPEDGATTTDEFSIQGIVYNPCLPGGSVVKFSSRMTLDDNDVLVWPQTNDTTTNNNTNNNTSTSTNTNHAFDKYSVVMRNDNPTGDFNECSTRVNDLLRKDTNAFCNLAHRGDCSFAGVYQPPLPTQTSDEHFGEFLGFSNYYSVWQFLQLESRSSIAQLEVGARKVCNMSLEELKGYNEEFALGVDNTYDLSKQCFHAVYVYQLLHHGYGFEENEYITATKVINGHKVGWALGSMLYEINTLPWRYVDDKEEKDVAVTPVPHGGTAAEWEKEFFFVITATFGLLMLFLAAMRRHGRRSEKWQYRPIQPGKGEYRRILPKEGVESNSPRTVIVREYNSLGDRNGENGGNTLSAEASMGCPVDSEQRDVTEGRTYTC